MSELPRRLRSLLLRRLRWEDRQRRLGLVVSIALVVLMPCAGLLTLETRELPFFGSPEWVDEAAWGMIYLCWVPLAIALLHRWMGPRIIRYLEALEDREVDPESQEPEGDGREPRGR